MAAMDTPAVKIAEHEEAAHEQRNWVRLTFDCNDRCVFCLDAHTHDGTVRAREEIKAQILDGRRKGAQRLILSGGEPTIHPDFVDFVRLGRLAGYRKVQTVTNGRMFAYPEFLKKSLDAGLSRSRSRSTGRTRRSTTRWSARAGRSRRRSRGSSSRWPTGGRSSTSMSVSTAATSGTSPELLATFTAMGVREFDLLHVIPFGRAYTEGKETLFYDLEEARPYLLAAFAYARKPGIHIWLNRFPPQHLEGFEDLIQDPYKLGDEVRGRKEEYAHLLERGVPLDCRAPHRCGHCYLEPLCDTLEEVRATVAEAAFAVLRIDTEWEARQPAVYGGDPASKKRADTQMALREQALVSGAEAEAAAGMVPEGRVRLPVLGDRFIGAVGLPEFRPPKVRPLPALAAEANAAALWLVAPDLTTALRAAEGFPAVPALELELADVRGLLAVLAGPEGQVMIGKRLRRVVVRSADDAAALLATAGDFEVALALSRATEGWLLGLTEAPARLVVWQPTHEKLSESAAEDVDLPAFFGAFTLAVPVEGVPACVLGRAPRTRPAVLDAAMLTPEGRVEIFRYARRYVLDRFRSKSLRCKPCTQRAACDGLHINYVRAHGYAAMRPILADGYTADVSPA
jgi:hypothetical protein